MFNHLWSFSSLEYTPQRTLDGAPGLPYCGCTNLPIGEERCECRNCDQLSSVPAHPSYPEKPSAL